MVTGVLLFLLLAFATATVFVREAWALQCFQIGIYILLAVYLVIGFFRKKEYVAGGIAPWLVYLIPLWGALQIFAHTTASSFETRQAVLRWGSLAGVFFLSQAIGHSTAARRNFLSAFLLFATAWRCCASLKSLPRKAVCYGFSPAAIRMFMQRSRTKIIMRSLLNSRCLSRCGEP